MDGPQNNREQPQNVNHLDEGTPGVMTTDGLTPRQPDDDGALPHDHSPAEMELQNGSSKQETNGSRKESNAESLTLETGTRVEATDPENDEPTTVESIHRFMPIERLNVFSDAMFATVTTFMVVPLKEELESYDVTQNLLERLLADWYRFAVFILTFIVVSSLWQDHVLILQKVEHVGDIALIVNVFLLLTASVIPFMAALVVDFYQYTLTAQLVGGCILILAIVQGLLIVFSFRRGKMLSEFDDATSKKWLMREFLCGVIVKIVLSVLAIIVALASPPTALALLLLAVFSDCACIVVIAVYRSHRDNSLDKSVCRILCRRFLLEDVDMDRMQTFTDGVFVIVATLMILDITSDSLIPLNSSLNETALYDELVDQQEALLAYLSTFVTIGMIWYINYSMFFYLQRLSRLLLFFNRLTLLFISVLPLGFQLVALYSDEDYNLNENVAVQFHCLLIFGSTTMQLIFWLAAHWRSDKHLHPFHQGLQKKRIYGMLLVYPITSVILFCAAFSQTVLQASVVYLVELVIPILFVVLKLTLEVLSRRGIAGVVTREGALAAAAHPSGPPGVPPGDTANPSDIRLWQTAK